MPRNIAGVYSLPPVINPVVPGTIIDTTWANPTLSDVAQALTDSIDRQGRTTILANLPLNSFKFTGAASATVAGEFLVWGQALRGSSLSMPANASVGYEALTDTKSLEGVTVPNYGVRFSSVFSSLGGGAGSALTGYAGILLSTRYGLARLTEAGSLQVESLLEAGEALLNTINMNTGGSGSTQFAVSHSGQDVRIENRRTGALYYRLNGSDRFGMTTDGRLFGTALHNNAGSVAGAVNQYVASGTYTPSVANQSNITAVTPQAAQWMRVGNVVTVSGEVAVQPASAASATFSLSLPIAVTGLVGETHKVAGVLTLPAASLAPRIRGSGLAATQVAWIQATYPGTSSYVGSYSFTYLVE